jgi:hypothetical protein
MHKVALVLAIAAIGEGAVTLHLVRQLHEERENAQTLQARVTELERNVPQPAAGATFIAVPTQPTVSPFTTVEKQGAPPPPPPGVASGTVVAANAAVGRSFMPMAPPDQAQIREQMKASMERQRALMRDPDYREAMRAQQRMGLMRSNPNVARDLELTAEQVDRLFDTLAEQQLRSMENTTPMMWGEQPDPAKMQEFHRKTMEQQSANEAELKRALGEGKYREWQEYQSMAGVRWEADRVRTSLASAGVPLDENLTKPLLKTLAEQQQKMLQEATKLAPPATNRMIAAGGLSTVVTSDGSRANILEMQEMQEKSLEFMAQHQKRQRDALARVLTPEQLKIVEDEQSAELQMQRAQLRMMRAQQEAGLLDPAAQGNNAGYIQDGVTFVPSTSD